MSISCGLGFARKKFPKKNLYAYLVFLLLLYIVIMVSSFVYRMPFYVLFVFSYIKVVRKYLQEILDRLRVVQTLVDREIIRHKVQLVQKLMYVLPSYYAFKV